MHRVADVVIQQQDRIMDVVMRETGKPRARSYGHGSIFSS